MLMVWSVTDDSSLGVAEAESAGLSAGFASLSSATSPDVATTAHAASVQKNPSPPVLRLMSVSCRASSGDRRRPGFYTAAPPVRVYAGRARPVAGEQAPAYSLAWQTASTLLPSGS